ncbi:ROK family protein [Roseobacter weihaiensis]|uniref:ROK family protein n=1 Tax=Roseobacter weihaiensis TaxID=2763262 RepID=UPI001D0A0805|nr:ROK family protein [Roseobacter sp. H9]
MKAGPYAVFDIGGTFFRSALWRDGLLSNVSKRPSLNFLNTPHLSPCELQNELVTYLLNEAARLEEVFGKRIGHVGISLGAPMNAKTGEILQSGPLWGPEAKSFDLLGQLRRFAPARTYVIANDVTAALLRYVRDIDPSSNGKVLYITISTGVGSRLFDAKRGGIPTDSQHGFQGEIGHLPTQTILHGSQLSFRCDCGGKDHLNAFTSGRGILNLLREQPKFASGSETDDDLLRRFTEGVHNEDLDAIAVLDASTSPLAQILAILLTHDPIIETIVLTGGVVHKLEPSYCESLNRQFLNHGLFQVTDRDPDYLMRRLRIDTPDDSAGLVGAGHLVETLHSRRSVYVYD